MPAPALLTLPSELLLLILTHLFPLDIEPLALTLNHTVTPLCLPLLQPLFAQRRHQKTLLSLHGPLSEDWSLAADNLPTLLPPPTNLTPLPAPRPRLNGLIPMDGSLSWLRDTLDAKTFDSMAGHYRGAMCTPSALATLLHTAAELDIHLPPALLTLLHDEGLQRAMPSITANYFTLKDAVLRKVAAGEDGGAGGYVLNVWSDQQECFHWTLYVVPGADGFHAMLGSAEAVDAFDYRDDDDDEDAEREDEEEGRAARAEEEWRFSEVERGLLAQKRIGKASIEGVVVEDWDFENWLAVNFFENWAWFVCEAESDSKSELERYLRWVYVDKGGEEE